MAASGVLSSWETLATKSRRMSATRVSSVVSRAATTAPRSPPESDGARQQQRPPLGGGEDDLGALRRALAQGVLDQPGEAGVADDLQRRPAGEVPHQVEEAVEGGVDHLGAAVAVDHQHPLGHAGEDLLEVVALPADRLELLLGAGGEPVEGEREGGELLLVRHRDAGDAAERQVLGAGDQARGGLEEAAVEPERGEEDGDAGGQHGEGHGRRQPGAQGAQLLQRLGEAEDHHLAAGAGERAGDVDVGVAGGGALAHVHPAAAGEGGADLGAGAVVLHRPHLVGLDRAVGERRRRRGGSGSPGCRCPPRAGRPRSPG